MGGCWLYRCVYNFTGSQNLHAFMTKIIVDLELLTLLYSTDHVSLLYTIVFSN